MKKKLENMDVVNYYIKIRMYKFKLISSDNTEYVLNLKEEKLKEEHNSIFIDHNEDKIDQINIPFIINKDIVKYVEDCINGVDVNVINYSILFDIIKLADFLCLDKLSTEMMNVKSILFNEYNIKYQKTNDEEVNEIKNEILDIFQKQEYECKITNNDTKISNIFKNVPGMNDTNIFDDMIDKSIMSQNVISVKCNDILELNEVIDDCEVITIKTSHNNSSEDEKAFMSAFIPILYQTMNNLLPDESQQNNDILSEISNIGTSNNDVLNNYLSNVDASRNKVGIMDYYKYKDLICKVMMKTSLTYGNSDEWIISVYKNTDYSILLDPELYKKTDIKIQLITHLSKNNNITNMDVERIIMYLKIIKSFEK